ncbi:MAG TPA: bifunctional diguanylate cyclase/phosphodiesterase [Caulobacteraceae bacterium]|nr:bifunctional diguanylate cyclase/phosphodiesterase [Caulobacteraceae bacterium]
MLAILSPATALAAPARKAVASAASAAPWLMALVVGVVAVTAAAGLAVGLWMRIRRREKTLAAVAEAAARLAVGGRAELDPKLGPVAEGFNAMAEQVAEREKRVRHTALHDAETGLPNRFALEWRLTDLGQKGTTGVMLAAVSLDRLHTLRLAIGYEPAGQLLSEVARRLERVMPRWPIGRISSNALGVLFRASDEAAARKIGAAIVATLEAPLTVGGVGLDIDLTVGLAALAPGEQGARATVEHALFAVDQARAAHKRVSLFDAGAYGDPAANLALMSEMVQAIAAGDLQLFLQPRHDMRKGRTHGVEALVRWRHPRLGLLSPDRFVGFAEATGHIRPMTEWVLRQAMEHQSALKLNRHELEMAINVPGRLLSDQAFIEQAITLAAKAEGPIRFDVTEAAVMENPPVAFTTLERFSDAGIGIAIDDYGAGLSYLAHLKRIRADELKIDKAFILDLADSPKDALVVRTTVQLAHSLGMKVTAEGVETDEAYSLLAAMGCDTAQGFLIARPMPFEDLLRYLHEDRTAARRYG